MNYLKRNFKITSLSNPLIKEALRIKKRLNRKSSLLLIEGMHLVEAAALSNLTDIKTVFITESFMSEEKLSEVLKLIPSEKNYIVSEKILAMLADTETPQGIIAIVDYKHIELKNLLLSDIPLLVICDAVRDPGNIGTIIRAADAFGADGVVVLPLSCDPLNPKAVRSTAGSLFNIPVIKTEQDKLIKYLEHKDVTLYSTSPTAEESIYELDMTIPVAIVFGNEASGVNDIFLKKSASRFRIPTLGRVESLNVAMSAAICLYEVMRQRMGH